MSDTFTADYCKQNIRVDAESEVMYGEDQMWLTSAPIVFPTANIPLRDMSGLYSLADAIRMSEGHLPMLPQSGSGDDDDYDCDGWYDFYVGINRLPDGDKLDNCICFTVSSPTAEDEGAEYTIDLSETEQACVYAALDESAMVTLGKSLTALLDESEAYMREEDA